MTRSPDWVATYTGKPNNIVKRYRNRRAGRLCRTCMGLKRSIPQDCTRDLRPPASSGYSLVMVVGLEERDYALEIFGLRSQFLGRRRQLLRGLGVLLATIVAFWIRGRWAFPAVLLGIPVCILHISPVSLPIAYPVGSVWLRQSPAVLSFPLGRL